MCLLSIQGPQWDMCEVRYSTENLIKSLRTQKNCFISHKITGQCPVKEMRLEKSGHSSCFRQGEENNSEQLFWPAPAKLPSEGHITWKDTEGTCNFSDSLGHVSPAVGLISIITSYSTWWSRYERILGQKNPNIQQRENPNKHNSKNTFWCVIFLQLWKQTVFLTLNLYLEPTWPQDIWYTKGSVPPRTQSVLVMLNSLLSSRVLRG